MKRHAGARDAGWFEQGDPADGIEFCKTKLKSGLGQSSQVFDRGDIVSRFRFPSGITHVVYPKSNRALGGADKTTEDEREHHWDRSIRRRYDKPCPQLGHKELRVDVPTEGVRRDVD